MRMVSLKLTLIDPSKEALPKLAKPSPTPPFPFYTKAQDLMCEARALLQAP